MKRSETTLTGVFALTPSIYHDDRGHFFESYNAEFLAKEGFNKIFIQDNQSFSKKGVVRGLHFQTGKHAQGKLVRVIKGRVIDIALDLRPDSVTFGHYELFDLSDQDGKMVYIPEGFAHGFVAVEDSVFHYKCTNAYCKEAEAGIHWNDPSLQIPWGISDPIVSEKDNILPYLNEYLEASQTVNSGFHRQTFN